MRLLLDAHIPTAVSRSLQSTGIDAVTVSGWQNGQWRSASDELILEAARADERALVTYDCRTIPLLLKAWAEEGRSHAGIVFVDSRTIRPNDVGQLVRALQNLAANETSSWKDRVCFLQAGMT
jgi:predicted nuclease of predicted toxin-antitoxin system